MFGKKNKIALSKQIADLSDATAIEFLDYLKADREIYAHCINDVPIKNTTTLFMINLYRDLLNSKYNGDDVFKVITTTVLTMAPSKEMENQIFEGFMSFVQQTNEVMNYYSQQPDFNPSQTLTDCYYRFIIDDDDFFINELENSIRNSTSYKKIYNKIDSVGKNSIILKEKYNMRLK